MNASKFLPALALFGLTLGLSAWGCQGIIGPAPRPTPRQTPADAGAPDSPTQQVVKWQQMKPFFTEFCISCHGSSGVLSSLETYDDPKRGKAAKQFWALALGKVLSKKMPPALPDAVDAIARFNEGVRLFELWKKAGFPGPDTPPPTRPKPPTADAFPTLQSCKGKEPLEARFWRLTDAQIRYSLLDAFGESLKLPSLQFTKDRKDGFSNNAKLGTINALLVTQLVENFAMVSKEVMAKVPAFQSCLKDKGTGCVDQLIQTYGQKLWRRPIPASEAAVFRKHFRALESGIQLPSARQTALEFVVERLLTSPHFLYRSEVGAAIPGKPGIRRLTPYETASFLSYLIWQSIPDDALMQAAAKGQLSTQAELDAQALRMLKDRKARRGIRAMLNDWMRLDGILTVEKDSKAFPEVTLKLRHSLLDASQRFIDEVVWAQLGDLKSLFTSTTYFMDRITAPLYAKQVQGTFHQKVAVDPAKRAGLATTAAFLFAHSGKSSTGFVHRGVFFLEQLACRPLPPAPPGVVEQAKERLKNVDKSSLTQRDIQKLHANSPACSSCHRIIDPAGAAFELYDGLGRYRTRERGQRIDASGEIKGLGDVEPQFQDAVQLMRQLAKSRHFQQCYTTKLYTFALGGAPQDAQSCQLAKVHEQLKSKQFELKQSYQALLSIENLLIRKDPGK